MTLKEEYQKKVDEYYAKKLEIYGATPQGVDYNGPDAQNIRFKQLVKVIDPSRPFTVIDYGCGYGGLFDFMHALGWQFEYYGVDLIESMVTTGRALHKDFPNAHFTTNEAEVPPAEYLLAGAIFNVKLDIPLEDWRDMTLETLWRMNKLCTRGFSFNMLTNYSDPERMAQRPDLFFGDPLFYFDYCKRNFSRDVALLHDYQLYDFTILVRKS